MKVGHMTKLLLTAAALACVGSFAGLAMAQGKQGEASGSDVSSAQAKLAAQCAHRRTMPPDARNDCDRVRGNWQLGYGQDDASASQATAAAPGNGGQGTGNGQGIGAGNGNSQGIGPGNGGGQAKGRR